MKRYDIKSMRLLLAFAATVAAATITVADTGIRCCEHKCFQGKCWCVSYCSPPPPAGGIRG